MSLNGYLLLSFVAFGSSSTSFSSTDSSSEFDSDSYPNSISGSLSVDQAPCPNPTGQLSSSANIRLPTGWVLMSSDCSLPLDWEGDPSFSVS
mgnify:FL=1